MTINEESHKKSEIQKIYHLLHCDESDIHYLMNLSSEDLADLRIKVTRSIMEEQSDIWEPLARVTKFMPNFINAKVSEDILGPKITANITYHVPPKEAVSIANHFSTKFFCDVLEHVVPEKVEPIIQVSTSDLIRRAVMELKNRKNYYLIGSLIDFTPIHFIQKISMEVPDEEMIVILDSITKRDRMAELLGMYLDAKVIGLIIASIKLKKMDVLLEVISYSTLNVQQRVRTLIQKNLSSSDLDLYRNTAQTYNLSL